MSKPSITEAWGDYLAILAGYNARLRTREELVSVFAIWAALLDPPSAPATVAQYRRTLDVAERKRAA